MLRIHTENLESVSEYQAFLKNTSTRRVYLTGIIVMVVQRFELLWRCAVCFVNRFHHSIVGGDEGRCTETVFGDEGLLEDRGGTGCSPGLPAVCNYPFSSHQCWLPKQASVGQVSFQNAFAIIFNTTSIPSSAVWQPKSEFFFFFGQIRYHYKEFSHIGTRLEYKGSIPPPKKKCSLPDQLHCKMEMTKSNRESLLKWL